MKSRLVTLLYLLLFLSIPSLQAEEAASLNLKDADIRVLIDTVAKATGKNFVIDPRVKAQVTVVSAAPMRKNELYEVFLSILDVHGYAAVPSGNVIKILPDVNARQKSVPTIGAGGKISGDELVTRVIAIKHVPAAQLVPILRPLIPQQGQLAAYAPTNMLIVSDRASNIDRIVSIIRRIDRSENEEIEVIQLNNASASEVVRVINQLNRSAGQKSGTPNGLLLAADERTNSILLSGDPSSRLRVRGIIAHLDAPLETGGNTQVVFLKYANAEEMVTILQGVQKKTAEAETSGQKGDASKRNGVDIQADATNNALVLTGPSGALRNLKTVIGQLDVRRAQVMIEAIIAEVSTNLNNEFGVQMAFDPSNSGETGPAGIVNFSGTNSLSSLAANPFGIGSGALLGGADFSEGSTNFAILVNALAGDAATNILSTPTVMTMDNEEAEIVVGQNVPFVTGQFTSTGGVANATNPFQTIERQDIGITLKVKPQVNEGSSIKLSIQQEVSSVSASSVSASDLITNKRSINTTVTAEDGQIVVLGGLIEDRVQDVEQRVPVLGDIPVLGYLFRSSSTQKVKQNLMVFLHPVILRDAATNNVMTNSKYNYMRAQQIDAEINERTDGAGILPEDIRGLTTNKPTTPEELQQQTAEPVAVEEPETTVEESEDDPFEEDDF